MALDRQTIEKRDFPIGRRGYEPASVDAHLAKLAREVETLQRDARSGSAGGGAPGPPRRPRASSLATIASVQVQAIVEAAETTAAAIERDARDSAAQTEQDAADAAARIREEALARSQDHVGKVQQATSLMLQRVEAMDSELERARRLAAHRRQPAQRRPVAAVGQHGRAVLDRRATSRHPSSVVDYESTLIEPEVEIVTAIEEDPVDAELEPEPLSAPAAATAGDDDVEGARLIALNMALNGQTREETDKYLAENFDLGDRAGLLDEVYSTVEG